MYFLEKSIKKCKQFQILKIMEYAFNLQVFTISLLGKIGGNAMFFTLSIGTTFASFEEM